MPARPVAISWRRLANSIASVAQLGRLERVDHAARGPPSEAPPLPASAISSTMAWCRPPRWAAQASRCPASTPASRRAASSSPCRAERRGDLGGGPDAGSGGVPPTSRGRAAAPGRSRPPGRPWSRGPRRRPRGRCENGIGRKAASCAAMTMRRPCEVLDGVELGQVAAVRPHRAGGAERPRHLDPGPLRVLDQRLRAAAHPLELAAVEVRGRRRCRPSRSACLSRRHRPGAAVPDEGEHARGAVPLDLLLQLLGLRDGRHEHEHVAALEPGERPRGRVRLAGALPAGEQGRIARRHGVEPVLGEERLLGRLAGRALARLRSRRFSSSSRPSAALPSSRRNAACAASRASSRRRASAPAAARSGGRPPRWRPRCPRAAGPGPRPGRARPGRSRAASGGGGGGSAAGASSVRSAPRRMEAKISAPSAARRSSSTLRSAACRSLWRTSGSSAVALDLARPSGGAAPTSASRAASAATSTAPGRPHRRKSRRPDPGRRARCRPAPSIASSAASKAGQSSRPSPSVPSSSRAGPRPAATPAPRARAGRPGPGRRPRAPRARRSGPASGRRARPRRPGGRRRSPGWCGGCRGRGRGCRRATPRAGRRVSGRERTKPSRIRTSAPPRSGLEGSAAPPVAWYQHEASAKSVGQPQLEPGGGLGEALAPVGLELDAVEVEQDPAGRPPPRTSAGRSREQGCRRSRPRARRPRPPPASPAGRGRWRRRAWGCRGGGPGSPSAGEQPPRRGADDAAVAVPLQPGEEGEELAGAVDLAPLDQEGGGLLGAELAAVGEVQLDQALAGRARTVTRKVGPAAPAGSAARNGGPPRTNVAGCPSRSRPGRRW